MTHRVSLMLALTITAFVAADLIFNDGTGLLFLGRKMFGLIEYLAIWR